MIIFRPLDGCRSRIRGAASRALLVSVLSPGLLPGFALAADRDETRRPDSRVDEQAERMSIDGSYNFKRIDDRVTTSGVVGDKRLAQLKAQGYRAVINLLPDNNEYAVPDEAAIVVGQGIDYTHIPVEWSAPTRADFAAFEAAMESIAGNTVHIHCAANWRVSAFYGLYAERKGLWTRQQADAHMRGLWNPDEYPAWTALIRTIRAE